MKKARFQSEILLGHKGAALEVPFDPAVRWSIPAAPLRPGRRGHAVRGNLNGRHFESAIVPRSKRFWLLVDEALCRTARVSVGDTVRVEIEPRAADANAVPRGRAKPKKRATGSRTTRGR